MFSLIRYFSWGLAFLCAANVFVHAYFLRFFEKRMPLRILSGLALAAGNLYFMREVFSTGWMVCLNVSLVLLTADLFGLILRIFGEKSRVFRNFVFLKKRGCAFLIALIYVLYGLVNIHIVRETEYRFSNSGVKEDITVALISDSHLGNTVDADQLAAIIKKTLDRGARLIVLAGDIFDESTPREEYEKLFTLLSDVRAPKGIYYIFGNHDSGRGGMSAAETEEAFTRAGITVLTDESVLVDGWLRIIGRKEAGGRRLSEKALFEGVDTESEFVIVCDHQPADTLEVAGAGADLMLSGHTHNGQIFPVNLISVLLNINEIEYGHERVGETECVVSSGVSGWKCAFRTAGRSEYVLIGLSRE